MTALAEYVTNRPADAPDVYDLPRGELAVALYASDAPLRTRADLDDRTALLAWATQGLDRLGAEQAWWLDYQSRRAIRAKSAGRTDFERLWPDARRESMASDAAYRIAPLGSDWPGNAGQRPVEVCYPCGYDPETDAEYEVIDFITARDREFARTYPARAAADCRLSHATGRACPVDTHGDAA